MAQSKAPAPPPAPAAKPTKAQLAADLAAALQACSYDGSPVKFAPPDLSQGSGAEGTRVVAEIMKYTGLPQNFDVVRGRVAKYRHWCQPVYTPKAEMPAASPPQPTAAD